MPNHKRQTRKQLAQEQQRRLRRKNKADRRAANEQESGLLQKVDDVDLHFHGNLIVESRNAAITTAAESSKNLQTDMLVYFVDASVRKVNTKLGNSAYYRSAASIVHKDPSSAGRWTSTAFMVSADSSSMSKEAELAAIAGGLTVAATKRLPIRSFETQSYQNTPSRRQALASNPIARKIIVHSKSLRDLGVQVDLCWVPGHSGVEGNMRANTEAMRMAKQGGRSVRHPRFSDIHPESLETVAEAVTAAHTFDKADVTKRRILMRFDTARGCYVFSDVQGG